MHLNEDNFFNDILFLKIIKKKLSMVIIYILYFFINMLNVIQTLYIFIFILSL